MKTMNTLKTRIACLSALLLGFLSPVKADIVVTIDVTNKTHSAAVIVYQTTIVEIPLDENGHGAHTFEHIKGVHAELYYGMDKKAIFMEDGDRICISFDGADFKNKVTYEAGGDKVKIFNYLNQVKLLTLPDEKFALPFAEYLTELQKKENSAYRILKAWKLDKVSPRFVAVETGRIKYVYAGQRMMYAVGHPYVSGNTSYVPGEEYYAELRKYFVEDENLVELKEYREYMKEMSNILGCKGEKVEKPYDKTICMMNYMAENLENDKVKQALLNVLAIEQVEQYGIKDIDELLNLYNTFVTDPVLKAAFQVKYDAWDITIPGKPSPDFTAVNTKGKIYHLADFKGKYVYIDLWATWCGPCRKEMPFLKQLEEDFKGKNITFLSLSTDAKKADWLKMVQSRQMTGVQLYLGAGSKFQTLYKADGIPHFILLDPEGNIVNANMIRPSSPDIRAYLSKLL